MRAQDAEELETEGLDELLLKLEAAVSLLAGGGGPLEDLVAAHERALRLLDQAQARLAALKARVEEAAQSLVE